MTKKLICPNCKLELEYIKEYTIECNVIRYTISEIYHEVIVDQIHRNRPSTFYECNMCGYHGTDTIREFVVDGD